jgi:predicted dehydrogenase
MTKTRPVEIALLGAGARGELNLATLAKRHPKRLRFVAVAEPHDGRREHFARKFGLAADRTFCDWRDLTARPQLAEAVLNALPCHLHYESTLAALKAGYHVFLEKPMAHSPGECVHLVRTADRLGRVLMIALQCRYNRIYTEVKRLREKEIGRLMTIDCAENIGYWHFIMSYVRGIHRRASESHSTVLAKGIHDLDLIAWFAGARAGRVASFGDLSFFHKGNAPPEAPERCTDGCPVEDRCEFSAIKQFVEPGRPDIPFSLLRGMSLGAVADYIRNPRFRTLASVIVHDISRESRMKALRETDHGRCVFRSDNDVPDHQVVTVEYENGVTSTLTLSAFSLLWERTLNLHGTRGEIRSADFSGRLELRTYNPARVRKRRIPYHGIIHGGGDEAILLEFADAVAREKPAEEILTSARNCLESHLICFAAEEARRSKQVVSMEDLRQKAEGEADALDV